MRIPKLLIFASVLFSLSGCAYIPFSGGKLTGIPTEPLKDWREIASIEIVRLETNPETPYSVNVWMVAEKTHLYVFAGDNYSQWVQNIEKNNAVRLQAEGNVFNLSAHRVMDPHEFTSFALAWKSKYGSDHFDSSAQDTYLFRLE